jgi:LmbE family N-acetylglucosaminyl deacetylase
MATITFFHAHPDDESITTAGTMASLAEQGHRVVLVTATRGELGEIPDGLLQPEESLTERRMAELSEACRILGVARLEFLDYHDSGMAGEPTNDQPGSFGAADVVEAGTALAGILVEERSDVVVVYDEHGGYGHPDHVQVHRVGMLAAEQAATPVVYISTVNRDFFGTMVAQLDDSEWKPPEGAIDGVDTMGEPASRLTTEIDVTPWIETKREAMRAHASQIGETSFFLSMPDDIFSAVWGREWYIRVRPEVVDAPGPLHETELMVTVEPSGDGGAATSGRTIGPLESSQA